MRRAQTTALAAMALGVLLAGCSGAETPREADSGAPAALETLRARGDARFAARDWEGALAAYEQALRLRPDEVRVRYLQGVTLSHLDRADDAEAAFRWVVQHAPGGLEEARLSGDWLRARAARGSAAPGAAAHGEAREGGGRVEGRTEWAGLPATAPPPRLQILLMEDRPEAGRRYGTSVRLGERYTITDVPPGSYRLAAQVGMTRLWNTTVSVEEGRATTADLLPATSVAPPDALAPKAP